MTQPRYYLYIINCGAGGNAPANVYVGIYESSDSFYDTPYEFNKFKESKYGFSDLFIFHGVERCGKLAQSVIQNGKKKHWGHVFINHPLQMDYETALIEQFKIFRFYKSQGRSLNDDLDNPIKFRCKCGENMLESEKEKHDCLWIEELEFL